MTTKKEPWFSTTEREGKTALWVETEAMERHNILDLEARELTPDVRQAIQHAFRLGAQAVMAEITDFQWVISLTSFPTRDSEWIDGDVDEDES